MFDVRYSMFVVENHILNIKANAPNDTQYLHKRILRQLKWVNWLNPVDPKIH